MRTLALICCAYAANVLENASNYIEYKERDIASTRSEEILDTFLKYPFDLKKKSSSNIPVNLNNLIEQKIFENPKAALQLEVVAGVVEVFSKMYMIL